MKLSLKSLLPPRDLGWNHVRAACGNRVCHNKLLVRALPQSRAGIHVGERWFCSPDCFAAGAHSILIALTVNRILEMPRNPRLSLALAMLSKGYLSEAQHQALMDRSQKTGQGLEALLLESGLVTEKQIAAARAFQWGQPVMARDFTGQRISANLPHMILRSCGAAPLHYSEKDRRLVLGFTERVDYGLLQAAEQITGFRPEPCFITRSEHESILENMSHGQDHREVASDSPDHPERMSRTLGGVALEISAREATITRRKSWLWARLAGRDGTADVVFALQSPKREEVQTAWTGDSAELLGEVASRY